VIILYMIKEYYKLKDINQDIWAYQVKLRSLDRESSEYRVYKKFLSGLKVRRKALIKTNAGNSSFFHNGIPPSKTKISLKQQKLNGIDKKIRETKLRHEIELSELYLEREEVKKS
jgi:hypothetical protein